MAKRSRRSGARGGLSTGATPTLYTALPGIFSSNFEAILDSRAAGEILWDTDRKWLARILGNESYTPAQIRERIGRLGDYRNLETVTTYTKRAFEGVSQPDRRASFTDPYERWGRKERRSPGWVNRTTTLATGGMELVDPDAMPYHDTGSIPAASRVNPDKSVHFRGFPHDWEWGAVYGVASTSWVLKCRGAESYADTIQIDRFLIAREQLRNHIQRVPTPETHSTDQAIAWVTRAVALARVLLVSTNARIGPNGGGLVPNQPDSSASSTEMPYTSWRSDSTWFTTQDRDNPGGRTGVLPGIDRYPSVLRGSVEIFCAPDYFRYTTPDWYMDPLGQEQYLEGALNTAALERNASVIPIAIDKEAFEAYPLVQGWADGFSAYGNAGTYNTGAVYQFTAGPLGTGVKLFTTRNDSENLRVRASSYSHPQGNVSRWWPHNANPATDIDGMSYLPESPRRTKESYNAEVKFWGELTWGRGLVVDLTTIAGVSRPDIYRGLGYYMPRRNAPDRISGLEALVMVVKADCDHFVDVSYRQWIDGAVTRLVGALRSLAANGQDPTGNITESLNNMETRNADANEEAARLVADEAFPPVATAVIAAIAVAANAIPVYGQIVSAVITALSTLVQVFFEIANGPGLDAPVSQYATTVRNTARAPSTESPFIRDIESGPTAGVCGEGEARDRGMRATLSRIRSMVTAAEERRRSSLDQNPPPPAGGGGPRTQKKSNTLPILAFVGAAWWLLRK